MSDPTATPLRLWRNVHADALAHVPPENRPALRGGPMWLVLRTLGTSSGIRCAFLYRLSYTFRMRVPVVGRLASRILYWVGRHWYGCAIAGTARIGGGLMMPHPNGIVVGGGVVIGERAWIYQHVTIGGAPGKQGMPVIGRDARLFAGAVIVGPIRIGDDVWIGGNTVVACDVPDGAIARCEKPSIVPRTDIFVAPGDSP